MEETTVSQLVGGQMTGHRPTGIPNLTHSGEGLECLAADRQPAWHFILFSLRIHQTSHAEPVLPWWPGRSMVTSPGLHSSTD